MRVVMAGTFDPAFARNRKLKRLLELGGHEIVMCRVDLWGSDRVSIPNQKKAVMFGRAVLAYPRLAWRLFREAHGDVILVGYPGWFDMLLVALVARLRRIPVVFDVFISLYDTVVSDRKLVSPRSLVGRLCRRVDRLSLRLADRIIADTPAHADFFAELAGVPRERVGVVWLGAQDDVFGPRAGIVPSDRRVFFHGTFIGLQGLETIVRAAKLLEPDQIVVRVVGSGQEQVTVDRLAASLRPGNLELVGLVPLEDVPREIAAATVCLGIFGTSDKASRVVPNKLYECVAVGRPVVTGDTPAIRSAFDESEICLVEPGDPEALAGAVRDLIDDPGKREAIATAAHQRYRAEYSEEPLARRLDTELRSVIAAPRRV